ncbi:MAG: FAD-dependent oxidoreductase, partial [Gammaproteobacteria bacterium]|nr:FAD-dependent oxidoreductase [Gammaproteobacteria bacterium]
MALREQSVAALSGTPLDVLVVGGGINGAVSAAALTARGARVGLVDARDFAGFTSQHSSNLIWGGVKYMESYQFGLVAELCRSRNELMRRFPSAIREIRFLTTIPRGFRHHPAMLWAGSWLYWLIGRGHTRPPRYLRAGTIGNVEPVIDTNHSTGGLEYSDAYLFDNDARFVFGF